MNAFSARGRLRALRWERPPETPRLVGTGEAVVQSPAACRSKILITSSLVQPSAKRRLPYGRLNLGHHAPQSRELCQDASHDCTVVPNCLPNIPLTHSRG